MLVIIRYWCVLFCIGSIYSEKLSPIVTISDGQVQGIVNKTAQDGIVYYAYRGIPFAKKPVGELRFAAPVSNDPWTGILNATSDKDVCTQMPSQDNQSVVIGSEDCLYISVYTTNLTGNLPVMVWIYGGGFIFGSSNYDTYAPDYILEKDVLYVSFNYRLGIFGFLSTEDMSAPGNWGLKDQILALKWVKKNIAKFGGDPNKITIFGESAGAASVSYLVNSYLTKGLYRAAIMQSGNSLCLWSLTRNSKYKTEQVAKTLNIHYSNTTSLIERLRLVDYKKLKNAENRVTISVLKDGDILAGVPFGPVQEPDHSGAVLSGRTYEILASGKFNRVPTIIGFNSNELAAKLTIQNYALFMGFLFFKISNEELAPYDLTNNTSKRTVAGNSIKSHYFGILITDADRVFKFATIDQFNRPVRKTVSLMSRYSNVYYYQFSYEGKLGNPYRTVSGVQHAEDLNYIFYKNESISDNDALTVDRIVTMWTNFAKTLKPTPSNATGVLKNITWVPNNPTTDVNQTVVYLNINKTLTMQINPDQKDWLFYKSIYDKYGDPSYYTTY